MQNIEALLKYQREINHPGRELGEFLLQHSNSLPYLIGQLESYLKAAKADYEAECAWAGDMLRGAFKREGK